MVVLLGIDSVGCLILVVPDTKYGESVPIILGTNILRPIMNNVESKYGFRFQQTTTMPDSWYFTFQCMRIQMKELHRTKGRLGVIKFNSAQKFILPSNTTMLIDGKVDQKILTDSSVGITQMWSGSMLPDGVSITPALVDIGSSNGVWVELSNLTNNPVVLSPNCVVCQVQACEITHDDPHTDPEHSNSWIDYIHQSLSESNLTEPQRAEVQSVVAEWHNVFSKNDLDVGLTSLVKHRIQLMDETPFKQRHRKIPPALFNEVHDHLRQLSDAGIIRKSQSPWASNMVLVRKKDQSLRLCVDFRQLNRRTVKDAYALPRIDELLEGLGGN